MLFGIIKLTQKVNGVVSTRSRVVRSERFRFRWWLGSDSGSDGSEMVPWFRFQLPVRWWVRIRLGALLQLGCKVLETQTASPHPSSELLMPRHRKSMAITLRMHQCMLCFSCISERAIMKQKTWQ
ncbi:hypothetical protein RIF29_29866 [Crotalaria pallida]|uniref:Uncharacterized protein n=1 Tax=Crotalaria pallida TaxID=3830 RepID=A0AAN9HXT9_CROPI